MANTDTLDFSHHVSEVPAGETLPKPYHRQVGIQLPAIPDIQGAVTNYANSTNWMSAVGSHVAGIASNSIAQKLGSDLGKNPKGDIGIPLTDFDKVMQQSYQAQSEATLGLQANKLITDSNLELAKAPRITPDLIAKTSKSVSLGLQNIFKNAPSSIQGGLQAKYANVQLNQGADLTERMIREQKEDRRNNTALAAQMNNEHAYSFGMHGNDKAAQDAIESTKKQSEADVASRLMTPAQAKSNVDAARQSYLSGKMNHEYETAKAAGKGEEYLKSIADKPPSYLSDADYGSVVQNLMQHVNQQNALRAQDQSLEIAKFNTSVAMNPMAPDMAAKLQNLKNNVSPETFERAQLTYINALKTYNKEQGNVNNALASWNDPSGFARLTEKGVNKAFDMQVGSYVQKRKDQNNPISVDEAEVQVAASAGGRVTVFEKSLENKLLQGNPTNIDSASKQIQLLNDLKAGRVYDHISPKAKAIATQFLQQRGSMPDSDLARQITDNLSNINSTMEKTLDNSWNLVLSKAGAAGIGASQSLHDFALKEVGLDSSHNDKLGGNYFGVLYGNDIYNQLKSNFMTTRGDYNAAKKMTQDYVDQHYGETFINGSEQKSDSPIEKYLGYPGDTITPYVQQDLHAQLSKSFEEAKKDSPNDYWETVPITTSKSETHGVSSSSRVVEAIRHVTTKEGKKQFRYPVNLVGRAGNQWDVVVKTPYGNRNLFLVAPHVGVTTYQPNKESIEKNYKANKHKGWF